MGEVTAFPYGVSSFGTTLPSSIGMQSGQTFFVDAVNGNDGNDGGSVQTALSTLARAYALCVSGRGDVVYLVSDGTTAATARLTSLLTWSKNNTHLIGICAPSQVSQRARISDPVGQATTFPVLFKLDAAGCRIQNVSFFQGNATDEDTICVEMSSSAQRCYFGNVTIAGMGNATPAARAGSMSLKLGGAENVFERCTIGLDTITRGANSEIVVTVGTRNEFLDCLFVTYTNSASHLYVSAAASKLDRWMLFKRCTFINCIQSGSTAMTAAMSIDGGGSPAGMAILDNCSSFGATYWVGADTAKVMINSPAGAANSQLFGLGLTADHP